MEMMMKQTADIDEQATGNSGCVGSRQGHVHARDGLFHWLHKQTKKSLNKKSMFLKKQEQKTKKPFSRRSTKAET